MPRHALFSFSVVAPRTWHLSAHIDQVTGIFFESKIDYTTWFGDNVEYIHGIQVRKGMRMSPSSRVIR